MKMNIIQIEDIKTVGGVWFCYQKKIKSQMTIEELDNFFEKLGLLIEELYLYQNMYDPNNSLDFFSQIREITFQRVPVYIK